jgi:hypothetical protein
MPYGNQTTGGIHGKRKKEGRKEVIPDVISNWRFSLRNDIR